MVKYNKCVYKYKCSGNKFYVVPIAPLTGICTAKVRGACIKIKIISDETHIYKENELIFFGDLNGYKTIAEAEEAFLANYKPILWEDGLFERDDGAFIFIYSINNTLCVIYHFDQNGLWTPPCARLTLKDILMETLKEKKFVNSAIPDLIYCIDTVWFLVKAKKYYAGYRSINNDCSLILIDKILNENICFKNGELLS